MVFKGFWHGHRTHYNRSMTGESRMTSAAFDLLMPDTPASGVIFASPHSGRDYPRDFLRRSVLDPVSLRSSEDAFVDRLFGAAPRLGAPLLAARVPRAFVDLNRGADELDPALIEGVPRHSGNPRINSGLGVIPRVVANGRAIYRSKLTLAEAEARLGGVWRPYHEALENLIRWQLTRFGEAVLIDCHSMPHDAIVQSRRGRGGRAEVVLGDRFGASASPDIVERVEAAFAAAGLRVSRNEPFAGAYVAERYGRPAQGRHVVQIEIDRALYMDERRVRASPGFEDFRRLITGVIAEIVTPAAGRAPLAAE